MNNKKAAGDFEQLLYAYIHSYLEAMYEAYKPFPAVIHVRALEILREKFRRSMGFVGEATLEEFVDWLKRRGYVRDLHVKVRDDEVIINVEGCRFAPLIHPNISKEGLCIWAALTSSIIASGLRKAKLVFHEELSRLTDSGSLTRLRIKELEDE